MWYRWGRRTWRCQEEYRCRALHWSPPHWSGRLSQMTPMLSCTSRCQVPRWRMGAFECPEIEEIEMEEIKLHKTPLGIYTQTISFIFYLFSHLHIFILWFIPPQVVIGPLLQQCAISDNFKFKMAKKSENERWNFTFCRSNINFYLFVLG